VSRPSAVRASFARTNESRDPGATCAEGARRVLVHPTRTTGLELVMAGLVPAIHRLDKEALVLMDARVKPAHNGNTNDNLSTCHVYSGRATDSVGSLPPCGGGLGRGVARFASLIAISHDPHPQPLPTRGRGAHRVCCTLRGLLDWNSSWPGLTRPSTPWPPEDVDARVKPAHDGETFALTSSIISPPDTSVARSRPA
jgi:hypothetical protein